MARYSISDTTLTALGDAIRNHVGETEYRDISTLSMPYRVNNRVNNGAAAYAPIPVCGATTIQLRRTGDSDNYATMYTQYCDANVLFPGTNEALITLRNFTNSTCGLYMITANDVTYEAEITWYDADGNQMEPLVPMEVPNTMTPENMADRINALTLLDPRLLLIDTLNYKFYNGCWDVFLENYGDKMTFPEPVSSAISTFYNSSIKTIPFEIPGYAVNTFTVTNMCQMAKYLEAPPIFHNIKIGDMTSMFDGCESLREFPEGYGEDWDWSYHTTATTTYSGNKSSLLKNCYSLRKLPMALFKYGNPKSDYSYHALRDFDGLYALDEVINMPFPSNAPCSSTGYSGLFYNAFTKLHRCKEFTFAPDIGVKQWAKQVLDFSKLGYGYPRNQFYNSGITADKEVTSNSTYIALKDDPDWFAVSADYSRYNYDSMVRTINSLPDCSEYAAQYGTNTIKFSSSAGRGYGKNVTKMPEDVAAIAAAKGWTISLG